MSKRSALDVIWQYTEAIAAGDSDRMNSLRSEDCVRDFVHLDAFGYGPASPVKSQKLWHSLFLVFPEIDYKVSCAVAGEDVVATRWVFTARNTGPLRPPIVESPLAPTGRTVRLEPS